MVVRREVDGVRVLLIRDPYENWGLPKGHLEEGEGGADAALREVREETGLEALLLGAELSTIDWYFRLEGRLVHKFCQFFLIESPHGEPVPQVEEGISACRWLPIEDAIREVTYDNAREVIVRAAELLSQAQPGLAEGISEARDGGEI